MVMEKADTPIPLDLKHSLLEQKLCPVCKVYWPEIEVMLGQSLESEDFWEAIHIVRSCTCCAIRFEKEIKKLRRPGL